MRRILFFDVDGTLVDSEHGKYAPDTEVIKALSEMKKNGYVPVVSSGRNMAQLGMMDRSVFDGFVFSDGGGILYHEECVLNPFPHDVIEKAISDLMIKFVCEVHACSMNSSYGSKGIYESYRHFFSDMDDDSPEGNSIHRLTEWKQEEILETDVFFRDLQTKKRWLQKKPTEIAFTDIGECYGELTMPGISKASGCRKLCEMLGVDIRDCYAFGDSMNDAEMLDECGTSIVMGNGDERLKETADYVTGNCEDGGLLQAFRHFDLL